MRVRRRTYLIWFALSWVVSTGLEASEAGPQAILVMFPLWIFGIILGVGRMHDVDRSGWFLFVPIYGFILCCSDGTPGSNRFGPDPKGRGAPWPEEPPEPVAVDLATATSVPRRVVATELSASDVDAVDVAANNPSRG